MIRDVHHVGIAVRDMDIALVPLVKQGDASARAGRGPRRGQRLPGAIQPTNDESPFARHIAERGEGLHHIALSTDDVESHVACYAMRARRERTRASGRLRGANGVLVAEGPMPEPVPPTGVAVEVAQGAAG